MLCSGSICLIFSVALSLTLLRIRPPSLWRRDSKIPKCSSSKHGRVQKWSMQKRPGVALAKQNKERAKEMAKPKSSWISSMFVWILVFFLGKTSAIHIELLFQFAPGKSSWTGLSLVWFAGVTPESTTRRKGAQECAQKSPFSTVPCKTKPPDLKQPGQEDRVWARVWVVDTLGVPPLFGCVLLCLPLSPYVHFMSHVVHMSAVWSPEQLWLLGSLGAGTLPSAF